MSNENAKIMADIEEIHHLCVVAGLSDCEARYFASLAGLLGVMCAVDMLSHDDHARIVLILDNARDRILSTRSNREAASS